MKLILASSSPRREKLLSKLNYPFHIISPNINEGFQSTEDPRDYCIRMAYAKAKKISNIYNDSLVIGADTIVSIKEQIFEKPKNLNNAYKMLSQLSGNSHLVHTAVSIININKNINHSFIETSIVYFRNLDDKDIEYYLKKYPPLDKAGSYGIQDWSAIFVRKIEGCYDNIVGFPISKFYNELKKLGINLLEKNLKEY